MTDMTEEQDKLLNLTEAAEFLDITAEDLRRLAEAGGIPAYKVGGVFLRFKVEQLNEIKATIKEKLNDLSNAPRETPKPGKKKISFLERLKEFWHFYDFYVVTFLIIAFIIYAIFKMGI